MWLAMLAAWSVLGPAGLCFAVDAVNANGGRLSSAGQLFQYVLGVAMFGCALILAAMMTVAIREENE